MNRLQQKIAQRQSNLIVWMRPRLPKLPLPMQRVDDPFLPFGKAIINATRDLVCGYMFDLAAYLAIGAAGAVALERTIAYVSDEAVSILHGPFASPDYAAVGGLAGFGVDAVTLTESGYAEAYLWEGVGVFVVNGAAGDVGAFLVDNSTLVLDGIVLRILGDDILYAGHGDDFAERVRAAVETRTG